MSGAEISFKGQLRFTVELPSGIEGVWVAGQLPAANGDSRHCFNMNAVASSEQEARDMLLEAVRRLIAALRESA